MISGRRATAVGIGAVVAALVTLACVDDGGDTTTDEHGDAETSSGTTEGPVEGPTWETGVAEIFAERCSGCHDWALDYALVSADTEYLLFRIENGHGDLTEDELAEVKQWIDNGAPL